MSEQKYVQNLFSSVATAIKNRLIEEETITLVGQQSQEVRSVSSVSVTEIKSDYILHELLSGDPQVYWFAGEGRVFIKRESGSSSLHFDVWAQKVTVRFDADQKEFIVEDLSTLTFMNKRY